MFPLQMGICEREGKSRAGTKQQENEMICAIPKLLPVIKQPCYQQKCRPGPALCPAGIGFTGLWEKASPFPSRHQQGFGVLLWQVWELGLP